MSSSILFCKSLLNSNSYLRSSKGALKLLYDLTLAKNTPATAGSIQINGINNRCCVEEKALVKQRYWRGERNYWNSYQSSGGSPFLCSVLLSFSLFGLSSKDSEKEETPEDKLVNTIKRSVLCIQRAQYEKAERLLHLALRMAQDLQHKDGITYCYDVMANLAMEREQFKKAEKLFAEVMRRLLSDGHTQNSPQILHISAKIAHIAQLQGELEKARDGFLWTINQIENKLKQSPGDKDMEELLGLAKNWFGQLLMQVAKYNEAKKLFNEAYTCLTDVYGRINEEAITILNNLSVACVNLDEFEEAKNHLSQALDIVKELKDSNQEGVIQANLGLVFLREGLIDKAKEQCSRAYRLGKKQKNDEAIEQAEYCLSEIKAASSSEKK